MCGILSLMLTKRKKQGVIKDLQMHDSDSGSAQVQIGLLTRRIDELSSHLKKNPKDNHSRRGLLLMVGKRRRFLQYLQRRDEKGYMKLAKKLGLKVAKPIQVPEDTAKPKTKADSKPKAKVAT